MPGILKLHAHEVGCRLPVPRGDSGDRHLQRSRRRFAVRQIDGHVDSAVPVWKNAQALARCDGSTAQNDGARTKRATIGVRHKRQRDQIVALAHPNADGLACHQGDRHVRDDAPRVPARQPKVSTVVRHAPPGCANLIGQRPRTFMPRDGFDQRQ